MNKITSFPLKAQGFTLTEIMVALAVSSILMAGVMQIFSSTKRGSVFNETQSRIQENLRFSVNMMAKDIRMAGYDGCSGTSITNTVEDGSGKYDLDRPIQGFEGVSGSNTGTFPSEITTSPYFDNSLDSDVLMIIRGGQDTGLRVTGVNPVAAQFQINTKDHNLNDGDILMLTDCTHTAVFQVTNASPGTNKTVVHQTGSTVTPGNCTKGLGSIKSPGHTGVLCDDPNITVNGSAYTWRNGASVVGFSISLYWVGTSISGTTRSLFKTTLATGAATTTEEIVEGVEDFQVLYGQGTSANAQFAVRYVKANQADFRNTVNVKLGLTLVSDRNIKPKATTKTFTIADKVTTNTDRKLRYFINNTVKPRNRGIM